MITWKWMCYIIYVSLAINSSIVHLKNFYPHILVYNEKTFWIGGDDYIFEGTWRWTETGTTIGPYTRWKAGSPSTNTSKNCIAMTWEGDDLYWFDDHCRYWRDTKAKTSGGRYYYICEKPWVNYGSRKWSYSLLQLFVLSCGVGFGTYLSENVPFNCFLSFLTRYCLHVM